MPDIIPTAEQEAILTFAADSKDNLMISALAGAAKTSTLIMIAKKLRNTRILALAFNKSIAVEMTDRLPFNCEAKTMNALGHAVWGQTIGKKFLKVTSGKMYFILKDLVEALPAREKEEAYELFSETLRALDVGKTSGWLPDGMFTHGRGLFDDSEFFGGLPEIPTELQVKLLRQSMRLSLEQAYEGKIDFNDQIYMPTIFQGEFPSYPLVLVDEAQDLNPLQHAMLAKLAKKRLIAVGDKFQAIYGFRGADKNSITRLIDRFNMTEMHLSISFRCPINIVKEARWRTPTMQYPDWAIEGVVSKPTTIDLDQIPDGSAIICRNNAPLFSMALHLFANGRYPELVGNDLGKNLLKIMKQIGKPSMNQAQFMEAIKGYHAKNEKRSRDKSSLRDKINCLMIFARQSGTFTGAFAYAETIMNASGRVKLMTGHKSKGLEFENVFFLNQDLINPKYEQDLNLKYVIQTRSKSTLTYITLDQFVEPHPDELPMSD